MEYVPIINYDTDDLLRIIADVSKLKDVYAPIFNHTPHIHTAPEENGLKIQMKQLVDEFKSLAERYDKLPGTAKIPTIRQASNACEAMHMDVD